ncbi:hypothetical protein [Helicobacter ailurogastricus]|uniref:hypothetical protein n=1 Tax=Helicobacter ailurogastricus TaxID=1578720 RepID=UPI00131582BE|nr:hypothetical protein [Helicobacter ailurogastricus]
MDKAQHFLMEVLNANGADITLQGQALHVNLNGLKVQNFANSYFKENYISQALDLLGTSIEHTR